MKYFHEDKINKGKKFINAGISFLFIFNFINILAAIINRGNISIKEVIIYNLLFLIVVFLYYKGNKIAFKIVSSNIPFLVVTLIAISIFASTFYILKPFGILNIWGGSLFLIILMVCFGAIFFLFFKIGWFECIEEYRLYSIDKF